MIYQTKQYVNGNYLSKVPDWHEDEAVWKAQEVFRMLSRNRIHPKTVCDVGCGTGGILSELQKKMSDDVSFTGFDISPQAFSICKKKENKKLKFYNKDFVEFDLEPFDVLLLIDVLEHIPDYLGFLNSILSRARWFIFHIPLDISVHTVAKQSSIIYMRKQYGHLHYFLKETALKTLEDTGFHVEDFFYTIDEYSVEDLQKLQRSNRELFWLLWLMIRKFLFKLHQDVAARCFQGFNLLVLGSSQVHNHS